MKSVRGDRLGDLSSDRIVKIPEFVNNSGKWVIIIAQDPWGMVEILITDPGSLWHQRKLDVVGTIRRKTSK